MTYNKSKANWDQHLHKALRVLRTRRNAATGQTPAYTVLGFEPPQAGEWAIRAYQEERRQQSQVLEGETNQGSAASSVGVSGQVRSARSGPAKELQSRRPGVRQGITPTQSHIRSPMVGAAPGDRQVVKGSLPSEEGKAPSRCARRRLTGDASGARGSASRTRTRSTDRTRGSVHGRTGTYPEGDVETTEPKFRYHNSTPTRRNGDERRRRTTSQRHRPSQTK